MRFADIESSLKLDDERINRQGKAINHLGEEFQRLEGDYLILCLAVALLGIAVFLISNYIREMEKKWTSQLAMSLRD